MSPAGQAFTPRRTRRPAGRARLAGLRLRRCVALGGAVATLPLGAAARPAVLGRGHRRCPLRRWRGRLKAGLVVTRLLRLDMHMTSGRWSAASQGRVLGQVPLRCGQLCWHAPGSRRGPGCWVPRRGAAHPWGRTPACVAQQASAGAGAQGRRLLFALLRCAAWLTFTPTLAPASASQLMTARP